MISIRTLLLIATSAVISACQSPPVAPAEKTLDPTFVALDTALEKKQAAKPIGPETKVAPPVYGPKTSVSFMGDVQVLLANVAKGRGTDWTYEATGPHPHLPIYVQVNVKDVTFAAFLTNVAEQLGQRADIELKGKVIKLRYRSAS